MGENYKPNPYNPNLKHNEHEEYQAEYCQLNCVPFLSLKYNLLYFLYTLLNNDIRHFQTSLLC